MIFSLAGRKALVIGITNAQSTAWDCAQALHARALKTEAELLAPPEVQMALSRLETGGFVEAVIRMLILLADSRGAVRQDRLERSARVLTEDEPFHALGADKRARIIHEQTLIVEFAHEEAIASLPALLPTAKDRELAAQVMLYVPGRIADMAPDTQAMIARGRALLGQPGAMVDVTEDPLSPVKAIAGPRAEITSHPIMEDHV